MKSQAVTDVLAERIGQIAREGWTPMHDDEHAGGVLAKAAVCYALCASVGIAVEEDFPRDHDFPAAYADASAPEPFWPWAREWWKPKSPRRDLVRAAALIIAEIERLDRAGRR